MNTSIYKMTVDLNVLESLGINLHSNIAAVLTEVVARLLNVKTKRNELAHGGISFEGCGQDTSVDELVAIFDEIKIFSVRDKK